MSVKMYNVRKWNDMKVTRLTSSSSGSAASIAVSVLSAGDSYVSPLRKKDNWLLTGCKHSSTAASRIDIESLAIFVSSFEKFGGYKTENQNTDVSMLIKRVTEISINKSSK